MEGLIERMILSGEAVFRYRTVHFARTPRIFKQKLEIKKQWRLCQPENEATAIVGQKEKLDFDVYLLLIR